MKIYNKNPIKIFWCILLSLQINIASSYTIFVVGPGAKDNWHTDLKKTFNRIQKKIGKKNLNIFPKIDINNERNIYATYVGDLDELSDQLATKIVNDFIRINNRSIEIAATKKIELEKKEKPYDKSKDKEKPTSKIIEVEDDKEKKDNTKPDLTIETKDNPIEKEKISLISYGQGAHVLVSALYKLKEKLKEKAQNNPNFGYFLEDIINDEIDGYQKPKPPKIPHSSTIWTEINDAEISPTSETGSIIDDSDSESEAESNKIIKIDLSKPMEQQLTMEQLTLLQNQVKPQNQNQQQMIEMLQLMEQIKNLKGEDEYAGMNPKLKMAGKITLVLLGTTIPVIITGIAGPILTALIL